MNKAKIGIAITLIVVGAIVGSFYHIKKAILVDKNFKQQTDQHAQCLTDNEIVSYKTDTDRDGYGIARFTVKDKVSDQDITSFAVDHAIQKHYHPPERYKCGVYVIREFNFDFKNYQTLPDFKISLWRYDYQGKGSELVVFSQKNTTDKSIFDFDFRVDPTEKYVVLVAGLLGNPNYRLVIRDITTGTDVFVKKLDDISKQYPDIAPGSFDFGTWSPDGKYLWGSLYDGADDMAYYRLERDTWKLDVFAPPPDLPSGAERAFNLAGYLVYSDITSFTGDADFTRQLQEEARKTGKKQSLWLYNFFTKEKMNLATADLTWSFKPTWLSDTELQYELPSGEKKIYTISK